MNWISLDQTEALEQIKEESQEKPVLIFKHSTRCSISATALNRLERSWKDNEMSEVKPYFLDLIRYRPVSSQVAEEFSIRHESPQVLLIHKGEAVYHASHMDISYADIKDQLAELTA